MVFPHGLFAFTLRGCTGPVTMTITYPQPLPPGSAYWKYGPQVKGATSSWYQFLGAIYTPTNTCTLTLQNNALGDDDWDTTPDIVDQGGPGAPFPAIIPVLGFEGLVSLAAVLALLAVVTLRRTGS